MTRLDFMDPEDPEDTENAVLTRLPPQIGRVIRRYPKGCVVIGNPNAELPEEWEAQMNLKMSSVGVSQSSRANVVAKAMSKAMKEFFDMVKSSIDKSLFPVCFEGSVVTKVPFLEG